MTSASPYETIRARLVGAKPNGKGIVARCPAHEDEHQSLSVHEGDDGRALAFCHAGCTADAIVTTIGLRLADLFPRKDGEGISISPNTVARRHTQRAGLNLAAYAEAKQLPIAVLQELRLGDVRLGSGRPAVQVPHRNATGKKATIPYRNALTGADRFTWKKGCKPLHCGAWNAGSRPADVLLVEGESGCGGGVVKSWLAKSDLWGRTLLVRPNDATGVFELRSADSEQSNARLRATIQAAVPCACKYVRQKQAAADALKSQLWLGGHRVEN